METHVFAINGGTCGICVCICNRITRRFAMAEPTYHDHARDLNRELRAAIPKERLTDLHQRRALATLLDRHTTDSTAGGATRLDLPRRFVLGLVSRKRTIGIRDFQLLRFATRIRASVHFPQKTPAQRPPGLVYGWISGLAFSQFKRWHLDHHDHLGSSHADPKRAHLSPRINSPWFKLLYCTPMLFPIYFRAVAETFKGYPEQLSRQIKRERTVGIVLHLGVLAWFWTLDPWFAFKAHLFPVFFIFPIAFTVNRLGQHYVINQMKLPLDDANASQLDVEFSLSVFDISPGTSLFPRRAILQPAKLQKELEPFFQRKQMVFFPIVGCSISGLSKTTHPIRSQTS